MHSTNSKIDPLENHLATLVEFIQRYKEAEITQAWVASVATVMINVFQKNELMVSRKLAKIMRIFVDIGHIKSRGVIYWPERIGPVIPTLWSGHIFGHEF
jgi:hypothetical protein